MADARSARTVADMIGQIAGDQITGGEYDDLTAPIERVVEEHGLLRD